MFGCSSSIFKLQMYPLVHSNEIANIIIDSSTNSVEQD